MLPVDEEIRLGDVVRAKHGVCVILTVPCITKCQRMTLGAHKN
jgi:hypothetical protein